MILLNRTTKVSSYLMKILCTFGYLAAFFGHCSSVNTVCTRVVGGDLTTISNYPHAAVILFQTAKRPIIQICGGTILNERHILTAAHCFTVTSPLFIIPKNYVIRVGSTMASSGGTTHIAKRVIMHPEWNPATIDSDVAIIRTKTHIAYGRTVQPAYIASENYQLGDDESVWAVGWGATGENGIVSEQLRHVQVLTVNREACRRSYESNVRITKNMMCAGILGVGGRDQCTRDSGSPVYHYNVVVGIASMGLGCARPCFPGINVQISNFANWIRNTTKPGSVSQNSVQLKSLPMKIYFNINL